MSRGQRQFLLRGLLSAALIALLLSRVRWHELTALLGGVQREPLFLGAVLVGACPFLMAARARLMLGQWGVRLAYPPVLGLSWLGQFCNIFLPGTGGDLVKFYRICRLAPEAKTAGCVALVADRIVALIALVGLVAAVALFGDHRLLWQLADVASAGGGNAARWWVGGGLLAAVGGAAAVFLWRRNSAGRTGGMADRVRQTIGVFGAGLRPSWALAGALLLALAIHLQGLACCYLFCQALEIPATFTQIILVWPVVMVAAMLPLSVNGHGLREYILLYYFQHWHLTSGLPGGGGVAETVVALSLLIVMTDFFWSLPGGLSLLGKSDAPLLEPPAETPPLRHAVPTR